MRNSGRGKGIGFRHSQCLRVCQTLCPRTFDYARDLVRSRCSLQYTSAVSRHTGAKYAFRRARVCESSHGTDKTQKKAGHPSSAFRVASVVSTRVAMNTSESIRMSRQSARIDQIVVDGKSTGYNADENRAAIFYDPANPWEQVVCCDAVLSDACVARAHGRSIVHALNFAGESSPDVRFTMDGLRQASADATRPFFNVVAWLIATTVVSRAHRPCRPASG